MRNPENSLHYVESTKGIGSFTASSFFFVIKAVIGKGFPVRFHANGLSMYPFIRENDIIILKPATQKLCVGDVVAYSRQFQDRLIIHRVVKKKGGRFVIKGDREKGTYDMVPRNNILGKVHHIERRGRITTLGLGREKYIIALLIRNDLLSPLVNGARKISKLLGQEFDPE